MIIKAPCHLPWVQAFQCPPFLPSSRLQAPPALEHRKAEYQTSCHNPHHIPIVLDTWPCWLTLGPGIPCSPWKALFAMSVWQLQEQIINVTIFYQDWDSDIFCKYSPWIQGTQELLVGQVGQVGLVGKSSEPENHWNRKSQAGAGNSYRTIKSSSSTKSCTLYMTTFPKAHGQVSDLWM